MTTNEFNPSPPPWLRGSAESEPDRRTDPVPSGTAAASSTEFLSPATSSPEPAVEPNPVAATGPTPGGTGLPPLPRRIRSIPLEIAYPDESAPAESGSSAATFATTVPPSSGYPAPAEYDTPPGRTEPVTHGYDTLPRADYPAAPASGHAEPAADFDTPGRGFDIPPRPGFETPPGPGFDTPPRAQSAQPRPVYSWAPPADDRAQHRARSVDELPPMAPPAYRMHPPPTPSPTAWQTAPAQPPLSPSHPAGAPVPPATGGAVNDLSLLKRAKRPPRSGWRRAIHKISGGAINPGESAADIAYRELVDRVNQPVRGDYRIAILSLKGGVGKTTTTIGLGSTFAALRGDRVIAVDANPDLGTLAHRIPRQTRSTVRNLLEDPAIHRYSDVRAHTSQAPSRLEILASEQDPAVSEAFSADDYRRAVAVLQQFYNIILTDCGTGLMHSAMSGVLTMASSLVLVTSPAIDGARSASATLDWLDHHGYGSLVKRTVVVVNSSRRGASTVDLDQLRRLFLDRTRAVQVIPFDDHLAEGAEIDLELVGKATRKALLELAAMVADDFNGPANPGEPRH